MTYKSPKTPVRMMMHGFGYIGRIHVLAAQMAALGVSAATKLDWRLCVVRDTNSLSAQQASEVFKVVSGDLGAVTQTPVDAVDIVSPNKAHKVALEAALSAKAAIYCEKPLAESVANAELMTRQITESGLVNQVALVYRFHPAVEQARALLLGGTLGKILTFRGVMLHGGYLSAERPMSWRLQADTAGDGAIMDLGVHMFDTVRFLLGDISAVQANVRTYVPDRIGEAGRLFTVTVDDWATVTLHLANGCTGTVEVSRIHHHLEETSLTVVCEKGTIRLPLEQVASLEVYPLGGNFGAATSVMESYESQLESFRPSKKMTGDVLLSLHTTSLATFVHRVQGGAIDYPVPLFVDALHAEKVVAAVKESSLHGNVVEL